VLTENLPPPKFNAFEVADIVYPLLYQCNEGYLIPNSTYVPISPTPHGLAEAENLLWNTFIKLGWAGGTRYKFK